MNEVMSSSEPQWHTLLSEPMAVLGPYRGAPPNLSSFAAHGLRMDLDVVCFAGQFLDLPTPVPEKWIVGTRATAYAVFQFFPVRRCELVGTLAPAPEDDSLHYQPVGRSGECHLLRVEETFFHNPESGLRLPWKRFVFKSEGFSLVLEAGSVILHMGRQAMRSHGWPNAA